LKIYQRSPEKDSYLILSGIKNTYISMWNLNDYQSDEKAGMETLRIIKRIEMNHSI